MSLPPDLFTSCLSPTDSSTLVRFQERIARAAPQKHVEAFVTLDFQEHAALGHAKVERLEQPVPVASGRWGGLSDDTIRSRDHDAAYQVTWNGHALVLVHATWKIGYGDESMTWVIGDSREVVRSYALEVARITNDPRDSVLVFHGSCWNRSREHYEAIRATSFDDVVLASSLKEQIRADFRRFLAARDQYEALGLAWRRGALFLGPPGNGKTHTIRALLKELAIPSLYVQSVKARYETEEANLKRVFERARQLQPCVLVLEDLDALVNAENRSFFLNQLDGFEKNVGLVVIATTNHPERIDSAMLDRPSRFDRKYTFALPALAERRAYLAKWQTKLAARADFLPEHVEPLAERTEGFSFAYLKELVVAALLQRVDSGAPFAELLEAERVALAEQRSTPAQKTTRDDDEAPAEVRKALASSASDGETSRRAPRARGSELELPHQRVGAELPHHADRLEEDLPAHLRVSRFAVDEDNRHFRDLHPAENRAVGELHLERVAVGSHRIEANGLEGATGKRLVAARQVFHPEAEDRARIERAALREHLAPDAPPLHSSTRNVARADHHVGATLELRDERGQVLRIVRHVGVHLEEALVALGEASFERLHVRGAETELARPMQHTNVVVLRRELVRDLAGAVRRGVVDDEDVRFRKRGAHPRDEPLQVVSFVVSRRHDERTGHRASV